MAAGPVHDRHVLRLQARQAATDIVDLGHHEVQMMEMIARATADADAMVIGVGKGAVESDALAEAVGLPLPAATEALSTRGLLRG